MPESPFFIKLQSDPEIFKNTFITGHPQWTASENVIINPRKEITDQINFINSNFFCFELNFDLKI